MLVNYNIALAEGESLPTESSVGGNVTDFLGTIKALGDGDEYVDSADPQGNPFEGQDVRKMVDTFISLKPHDTVNKLRHLNIGLDVIYGVEPGKKFPDDLPDQYHQAKKEIHSRIENLSDEK